MISDIANIITAIGTLTIAGAACFALRTWRKEFIGKKKIELAAEIMASAYEFQDILTPGSIKWPIYRDRLNCLTPIHRLNANITDNFEKIFNKSLMYWPEDLFKLLVELHSFLGKIRRASEMLYENPNVREYWDIPFAETTDNKISKRIFEIGDEIKQNLEPLYKDKQTVWKKSEEKK